MAGGQVDPAALTRLTHQVTTKVQVAKEKGRQMLDHREEYTKLRGKLETLR